MRHWFCSIGKDASRIISRFSPNREDYCHVSASERLKSLIGSRRTGCVWYTIFLSPRVTFIASSSNSIGLSSEAGLDQVFT